MKTKECLQKYAMLETLKDANVRVPEFNYARFINLKRLEPIFSSYEKCREELVRKYGKEQEDGSWKVSDNNLSEFISEIQPLEDMENDIELYKIGMDILKKIECETRFYDIIMITMSDEN